MFEIKTDLQCVRMTRVSVWVWTLIVNVEDHGQSTAVRTFEVKGFGTSLDAAHAEMVNQQRFTDLKLRLLGFSPKPE